MKTSLKRRLAAILAFVMTCQPLVAVQAAEYRLYEPGLKTLTSAVAEVSTTHLEFESVPVDSSSLEQAVVITNTGVEALRFEPATTVTGPFAVRSNCPGALAGGASCTFNVRFQPNAMGSAQGLLSIPTTVGFKAVTLTATGLKASVQANASLLDFGFVNVGASSASSPVELNNTGNMALSISAIQSTGPFLVTHNCPDTLAPGSGCSANVTFSPLQMGAASGSLRFTTTGGERLVGLVGTGLQTSQQLSTSSLAFSAQAVGTESTARTLTLTNIGNTMLTVEPAVVGAPFKVSTDCTQALEPNSSCHYNVTFAPTLMGSVAGTLTLRTSSGESDVDLSGLGQQTSYSVDAGQIAFDPQTVGTTSAERTVRMENTGNTPLNITQVDVTGAFVASHNCPGVLPAGASCLANVAFRPQTLGAASGTLVLATSVGSQVVTLTGTGLQARAALSASELSFPAQTVGTTSAAQSVVLSNTGNSALMVSSLTASGSFAASSDCGSLPFSVAAGAHCTVSVMFTPNSMGAAVGQLALQTSQGGQVVALSGTGLLSQLSLSSSSSAFGPVQAGQQSAVTSFTVSNSGNVAVSGLSVTVADGFVLDAGTCGATLAVGAACNVGVRFAPSQVQAYVGSLVVGAAGAPAVSASLSGSGVAPSLTLSSSELNFAALAVGSTSTVATLVMTNAGVGPVSVSGMSVTGPFTLTGHTCGAEPAVLASGASCQLSITFSPSTMGSSGGMLSLTTSAGNRSVALSGVGLQAVASLSTSSITFPDTNVSSMSTRTVVLSNTGNTGMTLNSVQNTAPFSSSLNCAGVVAPALPVTISAGGSCTLTQTFLPAVMGAATGTSTLTTSLGVQTVSLSGMGVLKQVTASTTSLAFGSVQVGQAAVSAAVTLTNTGNADVTALSFTPPSAYAVSNSTCGPTLTVGATCSFKVTFSPAAASTYNGTLDISTGATPVLVNMTGTGVAASSATSVGSLSMGNVTVGSTSTGSFSFINTGVGPVTLSSFSASGPFSVGSHTCGTLPAVVAAGGSCTVTAVYAASVMGDEVGSLTVLNSAGNKSVTLSGTGLQSSASASMAELSFEDTVVGATSAAQSVTLNNTGNVTLTGLGVTVTGPFTATTDCTTSLASAAACTVNVQFKPTLMGAASGTLAIATSAGTQTVSLSGLGRLARLSLSSTSLNLGAVQTGQSVTSTTLTLSNTGNYGGTALTPPVASHGFSLVSSTCGSSLALGASCTFAVRFDAQGQGSTSAALTFATSDSSVTLNASAVDTAPQATLSTFSLPFGSQQVGSTTVQSVSVLNTGVGPVTLSSITTAAPYGISAQSCGTLPATLAAGQSCNVNVTFNPTAPGYVAGSVVVASSAGNLTASTSGTGLQANASFSPTTWDFGGVAVGANSASKTLVLTNTGNTSLGVRLATVAAPFSVVSNACTGATLAQNATCNISVRYSPTAMGAATGSLSLDTDAGAKTVSLAGTGSLAVLSISPSSLSLGSVQVGQTVTSPTVTLTNTGNTTLSSLVLTQPGGFSLVNNTCGSTLAALASCTVAVQFTPIAAQASSGNLTVTSSVPTQTVSVTGTGVAASASTNVPSLTLSSTVVGSTSAASSFVINNTGVGPVTISSITPSGAFAVASNTCGSLPAVLAGGSNCTVNITFSPTVMGTAMGSVTVLGSVSAMSVTLSGTGLQTSASVSTSALTYAAQTVGSSSTAQAVSLNNTGNTAVTVSSVTATGDFSATHNCPASVAGGANCSANVTFSPSAMGALSGTLTFNTSAGAKTVSLTGTGQQQLATLTPSSLSFGSVTRGATSATQDLTLSNTGNMALALTSVSVPSPFGLGHNCPASLATGQSCKVSVYFSPTTTGAANATVSVVTGAGTKTATVSGTGTSPTATISNWAAGNVQVGQTSSSSVTVTNTSPVAITVTAPTAASVTGAGFSWQSLGTQCGGSLAAGASCVVYVVFSPSAVGSVTGAVSVNAGLAGTLAATLTGTGTAQSLAKVSTDAFSYNAAYAAQSGHFIGLTNNGYGPVTVSGLSSTSSSGNFSAWMAASGSGNPNGGYCWPGVVLQPGWTCGAWALDTGAAIGATSAGTATFSTSAGSVTYSGNFVVKGLTFSTFSPNLPVNAGTQAAGTLTLTNSSASTFYFPMYSVYGGASRIGRFTGTDAGKFAVTATTCTGSLAPGSTCTVSVSVTGISTATTYSASFQPNGSFQQSGEGTNGAWSNGQWLVNMGTTVADVYVHTAKALTVMAYASVTGTPLQYSDGTVAASCLAYRNGSTYYMPSSTSGLYNVNMGAGTETVYCDMATSGGGWTLVGRSAGTTPAYAGCAINSVNTTFGWSSAVGSVSATSSPYSMNVMANNLAFTEVLMAQGTGSSNAWTSVVWQQQVPSNFKTAYTQTDTPSPNAAFGMASRMGHTTDTTQFFFRDVPDGTRSAASSFGLHADGWFTCYGDGATTIGGVPASYGGNFNARHGLLYVR